MAHTARANRKRNQARKEFLQRTRRPLTPEEAAERTRQNEDLKQQRYPEAPIYRYRDSQPQPTQPDCYGLDLKHRVQMLIYRLRGIVRS